MSLFNFSFNFLLHLCVLMCNYINVLIFNDHWASFLCLFQLKLLSLISFEFHFTGSLPIFVKHNLSNAIVYIIIIIHHKSSSISHGSLIRCPVLQIATINHKKRNLIIKLFFLQDIINYIITQSSRRYQHNTSSNFSWFKSLN